MCKEKNNAQDKKELDKDFKTFDEKTYRPTVDDLDRSDPPDEGSGVIDKPSNDSNENQNSNANGNDNGSNE